MTENRSPYVVVSTLAVPTEVSPLDAGLSSAELNLVRRIRQLRRGRIAREVLVEIPTMTLRIVSLDLERLGGTG